MTLDLQRMRALVEIARLGSMTAAADSLSYTVSAISQQVRRLEAELGMPVLERHSRGVRLTDAGRAIVEHGQVIERQLAALDARLADIAGVRAGSLRLGTFPTAGASVLPLAITRFAARHRGVGLSLRSARITGLLAMLESRDVEMALLWDYPWSRLAEAGLVIEPLLEDATALVVAADHPLGRRRQVRMAELAEERWIIRAEEHPVAEVLRRAARTAGFEPAISFEAHDYQEAQAMVAVGLGIALAPRLALANVRPDVRVLSLGPDTPYRRVLLARDAGRTPLPAELAMAATLREVCRELGEEQPV